MSFPHQSRRQFLNQTAVLGGAALLAARGGHAAEPESGNKLHIACQEYPWAVFYNRDRRDFGSMVDTALAEVARSGVNGFEPSMYSIQYAEKVGMLLKKHGLEMRSFYVNSDLCRAADVEKSIPQIVAVAERAKAAGARIVVTNPSPVRWGGSEGKDDAQLKVQAAALDRLGGRLRDMGMVLAYHNHDAELRNAAREFHHMLLGTDPKNVSFCLDAHWVYRGSGNSQVALFDVVRLYGSRICELHLRQSIKGVWTEALCDGDLDYRALAKRLLEMGVKPHLVLEQAPEKGTPKTMDAVESHRRSCQYAREVFGQFA
ncbi:MAG: TIM barrel protein [Planctomycetota bacterium]